MSGVLIWAGAHDGHRREYLRLFREILCRAGSSIDARDVGLRDIGFRGPLLSLMLEEHTFRFVALASIRSILGLRSCTLLFRPKEVVLCKSWKHFLKRAALQWLKALPAVSVLTIVPHEIEPRFAEVANGWIYDPQLWDWAESDNTAGAFAAFIRGHAGERRVVVAIGAQSREKGFEYLADIYCSNPQLRAGWLFASVGKVAAQSRDKALEFEACGGLLIDRFISDGELRDAYSAADLVWSCYSPSYDQASGIFGRALQLGLPSAVRDGSIIGNLAGLLGVVHLVVPWNDVQGAARCIDSAPVRSEPPKEALTSMRRKSLLTLSEAMGVKVLAAGAS